MKKLILPKNAYLFDNLFINVNPKAVFEDFSHEAKSISSERRIDILTKIVQEVYDMHKVVHQYLENKVALNDTQRIDAIMSTFQNCVCKIAKDALLIVKRGGTLSDRLTDLIRKHHRTLLRVDDLKEIIDIFVNFAKEWSYFYQFTHFLINKGKDNPWQYVADMAKKSGHYFDKSQTYACKEDLPILEQYNAKVEEKYKFVLDILTYPFEKDIFNAKIIVLTLNKKKKKKVHHELYTKVNAEQQKQITDYHVENLEIQGKTMFPNEAVDLIGDKYWLQKSKELREKYGFQNADFGLIQHIGYQSEKFKKLKELDQLKSIEFTKLLIEFIAKRRTDDYCFIIARNKKFWQEILREHYNDVEYNKHVTELNSYLNTTLSKNNIKDWNIIERIMNTKNNLKDVLKALSKLQIRLEQEGGPEENGELFEQILEIEDNILEQFGLPINHPTYVELLRFYTSPTDYEISNRIKQLQESATAYLDSKRE
jgi:hypothetical protein